MRWTWTVGDVMPGAGPADWREIRREGETVEYHAATVPLEFWASDVEAYMTGLAARVPVIYVVMRRTMEADAPQELEVVLATASPYEAQDYMDSGEEIVDQAPMPVGLVAVVRDFIERHHEEEPFVKRRRDRQRVDLAEDGKGRSAHSPDVGCPIARRGAPRRSNERAGGLLGAPQGGGDGGDARRGRGRTRGPGRRGARGAGRTAGTRRCWPNWNCRIPTA